ncbi:alpha/beta hydrolase domain-containing protein [Caulobacter segnis]|uniref:alpha/beta hydrolase domain-containing protein n=1 Tax=Caulobacter segnis TaxID=88688 RepID=UPI00241080C0|nr:alpha/beta hydrolase domain-containing protein [Caulobacter segnis]MDG2520577.1 alpha/beta hydrolase domain-containing protein [Caulobacter segnis]
MRRSLSVSKSMLIATLVMLGGPALAEPTAALQSSSADRPFFSVQGELQSRGYVEEEWIVNGQARAHAVPYGGRRTGTFVGEPAPYVTRILVRRPLSPGRFNGVAVVEWENVSNGFPSGNIWLAGSEHLMRAGYVWVGVTAQGFGGAERLRNWNSSRYGRLAIPNGGKMAAEPYALGIFDDVGRLLRAQEGPLRSVGGPKHLVAAGQSQSGIWLTTYLNAGLAADGPFDGFVLSAAIGSVIAGDLSKPVLRIVPEGDVRGDEASMHIPDGPLFRQWEIAGASHVDRDLRSAREPLELRDLGQSTQAAIAGTCKETAIGTTTPARFVLHAGFEAMRRWIESGVPPRSIQRLARRRTTGGSTELVRSDTGRVVDGIQLPTYTAPIGIDVGANSGGPGCASQGYHRPFTPAQMAAVYSSAGDRARRLRSAATEQVRQGVLLRSDVSALMEGAKVGRW